VKLASSLPSLDRAPWIATRITPVVPLTSGWDTSYASWVEWLMHAWYAPVQVASLTVARADGDSSWYVVAYCPAA
jgi:hypothetical protein